MEFPTSESIMAPLPSDALPVRFPDAGDLAPAGYLALVPGDDFEEVIGFVRELRPVVDQLRALAPVVSQLAGGGAAGLFGFLRNGAPGV